MDEQQSVKSIAKRSQAFKTFIGGKEEQGRRRFHRRRNVDTMYITNQCYHRNKWQRTGHIR